MENKNQDHQTNERLFLIVYVCIAIIVGAFIVYRNKFNGILSDDFQAWGTFGDFLNPFIGIANIILLIFLTLEVKKIEERRDKDKDIEESKRLKQSLDLQVAITVSQRVLAISNLLEILGNDDLDSVRRESIPDSTLDKAHRIKKGIGNFHKNNKELFLDKNNFDPLKNIIELYEENIKSVIATCDVMIELNKELLIEYNFSRFGEREDTVETFKILNNLKLRRIDLKTAIENSIDSKDAFIWSLNKLILEDLKTT